MNHMNLIFMEEKHQRDGVLFVPRMYSFYFRDVGKEQAGHPAPWAELDFIITFMIITAGKGSFCHV